ncbi:unnamed protein product [Haemonchus placei]|uniref:Transposase n=1 Tax=Haemonchus placei TaxID=6290 RepID=A0A0N4WV14_HAEPC|nr:unnamed protein product [Haemonchus placei]
MSQRTECSRLGFVEIIKPPVYRTGHHDHLITVTAMVMSMINQVLEI